MRRMFAGILIVICVFMLSSVLFAENQTGISDKYRVNFVEKVRVADTVLPKGDYEIRHVMEGSDHIMIFRQLNTKSRLKSAPNALSSRSPTRPEAIRGFTS